MYLYTYFFPFKVVEYGSLSDLLQNKHSLISETLKQDEDKISRREDENNE